MLGNNTPAARGWPWSADTNGGGGGSGSGAASTGTDQRKRGPRGTPDLDDHHGIRFERTANAVEDLGWDPTGTERVSIPDEDGLLIEVPDGDYVTGHNTFFGTQRFGIVGLGDNVTLMPPAGQCARLLHFSSNDPGRNILLKNLELHQRDGLQAGAGLNVSVTDGFEMHHVRRTGRTPNRKTAGPPHGQEINGLSLVVSQPSGTATISHYRDHCETDVRKYPQNAAGISIWDESKGTVALRNISIKNQGEHALYGSKASAVRVYDSVLEDCANTNIRIAGEGSVAENCRIGYGREAGYTDHTGAEGRKATKVARIEDSRHGASGGALRGCDLYCETDGLAGGYLLLVHGNVGGFLVEDCDIRNDSDAKGCVVRSLGGQWRNLRPPGATWVRFNACRFGGSSVNPAVEADRDGVTLEGGSVEMPNAPAPRGVE